ncbi:fructosamine kinase family protein [Arenibaculum sp.]|uniref:fructosamine kinase family protein n=1 Tax=Arenibaculum sp. TaxID=2865862 RepID=UPI002E0E2089|nr:fructosamine kinase family protein [Arenibaculum sp.]
MDQARIDAARIETAVGGRVRRLSPLGGGTASQLFLVEMADGRRLVAKHGPGLAVEGFMLDHLARRTPLPVPKLHHAAADLLVMDHVETSGRLDDRTQEHAAELVAALHGVTAERYGFPRVTTIGPLPQPNAESGDWIAFFRDRRLLHMGRAALEQGRIDAGLMAGLERVAARLPELIGPPGPPSLVHGDLWGGNVLVRDGRVAAFIDPAIHHADAEVELAFTTLFGTFGEAFFRRYGELRPIRPGFFELRRDLYNLYPLLVHVRLFGGTYGAQAAATVRRLVG